MSGEMMAAQAAHSMGGRPLKDEINRAKPAMSQINPELQCTSRPVGALSIVVSLTLSESDSSKDCACSIHHRISMEAGGRIVVCW